MFLHNCIISKRIKWMVLVLLLFGNSIDIFAQVPKSTEKRFYKALEYIYAEKFNSALDILHNLDTISVGNFLSKRSNYGHDAFQNDTVSIEQIYVKYLISSCYMEMGVEPEKSIKYMEYVIRSGYTNTPNIIYKDLGAFNHKTYNFDKAIFYFNKYLKKVKERDEFYDYSIRMVAVCNSAKKLMMDTVNYELYDIGKYVNTVKSETYPMVSGNDSTLFFVRTTYRNRNNPIDPEPVSQIFVSNKKLGTWSKPKRVSFDTNEHISKRIAGISYNGDKVYVTITNNGKLDFYYANIRQQRNSIFKEMPTGINSSANEKDLYISKDGKTIYFSSDRAGGVGGYDLYKSTLVNKVWSKPENMGAGINTKYDEVSPNYNEESGTLFFSSNGHKTIGGFDIFAVSLKKGSPKVKNIGFPINTVYDCEAFSVSQNLQMYFTVPQYDRLNRQNIFRANLITPIKLTLLSGTLKVTNSTNLSKAKISILDSETNKPITKSQTPDPETGRYYALFKPGKYYNIVVNVEGFMPQLVTVLIPEQAYFYPLYQTIELNQIWMLGDTLGEKITVQNSFNDSFAKLPDTDSRKIARDKFYKKIESKLDLQETKKLINSELESDSVVVEANYSSLFSLIEEAIEQGDSITLELLDKNTQYEEIYTQKHYYNEDGKTALYPNNKGTSALYTAPRVKAFNTEHGVNSSQNNDILKLIGEDLKHTKNTDSASTTKNVARVEKLEIQKKSVYFDNNSSVIKPIFTEDLEGIVRFLLNNNDITLEIHGFSNSLGDEKPNLLLSQDRVEAIERFLLKQGIKQERIKTVGFGESAIKNGSKEKNFEKFRRADIIFHSSFEIN